MNFEQSTELQQWALEQWGESELGDERRRERAVAIGAAMAVNPSGSLPEQMGGWNELRAAYRLFGEADVTHEALSVGHWGKMY